MKLTGCERLTDVYRIVKAALNKQPVLVCYLDGFGYFGYREACQKERIPYIKETFLVHAVETVEPALTNPAMATMLTGVLPEVHGVVSRKEHRPKVPTIFADLNRPAAVIEGDSIIVQTEVRQQLYTASADETEDHAVCEGAGKAMEEGAEFLLVHFHGIDDAGHTYGPYADETLDKMEEIDGYVRKLCEVWKGTCFIVSDHGMHKAVSDGAAGDHGTDAEEDKTAIFGWYCPGEAVDVKELLEILALTEEPKQAVFHGEDGYASACRAEEIQKGGEVRLLRYKGAEDGTMHWRLAVESEPIARRWCKDVVEIELR